MATLYNAIQLKNGATVQRQRMGVLTQPIQMLPRIEKDADWCAWNMDWLERLGLQQLKRNAPRLLKNYKLAAGIIDRSDYIPQQDNETAEVMDVLTREDAGAYELKFFPIIPNVINVLQGEFQKRTDKITYHATDEISFNERLDEKYQLVEQTLLSEAEQTLMQRMQAQGMDLQSEEARQALAPEQLQTLPQIEAYMQKSWKSQYEQWAIHQHQADVERFHLQELESTGFKDMLVADREFWHFNLREDDYQVELWNPLLTFYHKSPEVPYIADGNHVGKIELMTISDAIDTMGWEMTGEQITSLQSIYAIKAVQYVMPGVENDGGFYDASRSHEWNREGPSLGMRQLMSATDNFLIQGHDILTQIMNEGEDLQDGQHRDLLRVTTAYWKSQMAVGHLTMISDEGTTTDMIVDESFRVTTKPVYDNSVLKGKSRQTLIYGQHVDWMWINQTWGGRKIGQVGVSYYGNHDSEGFSPIYLGVKPLRFQFKGDNSIYGCKLPVEGRVFSDRNTRSTSLVDKLKPFQLGYNMVNNQIADILIDELGTIILLDQNALPGNSLGEDWTDNGNALGKTYAAMKDFSMLALDTSIQNTEAPLAFQHYQVLNMEQTARLMSRVQLANYFKAQAFEAIGLNPERMGAVNGQQSGTSIEQATNLSYTQTEVLFVQHSEHLMPRVHAQRTDVAQHYQSTTPSVRLSYVTSMDEQINFALNGTELLGRDIGVFCSTKVNIRETMERIKALAVSNTTGASVYDLGKIVKAGSMAELDSAMKAGDEKVQAQRQQEQQAQTALQKQMDEAAAARQQALFEHEVLLQDKEDQNNIDVMEIRGAGNQTPDDNADYMQGLKQFSADRNKNADRELKREALTNQQVQAQQKADLTREGLAVQRQTSQDALTIARTNKNRYDKPAPPARKN